MTLKPLSNRVVIKFVEAEEKTQSGIFLTAAAQEKPQVAEVVATGAGAVVDGKLVPMTLKVGDKVIVGKYAGSVVKLDGVEYTILSEDDVLAIVE
jgi:chaperonin GroES